jgi:ribosomal protein S11
MTRITAATQANPCVITSAAHGFADGDTVYINNVVGMTELNGNSYTVAGSTTDTFQLSATNSSAYTAYTSGGTAATSANYATVEDYDTLMFGNHYLTTGIKIMPPPDEQVTVQVLARIYSRELTADSHVSFWSWVYPDILLLAAKIEIETNIHVNFERANAMNVVLKDKLKQIQYNLRSEEMAGDHSEYRMI